MAGSIFERIAYQVTQKYAPRVGLPPAVSRFVPAVRNLLQGNIEGAVGRALDQVLGPAFGLGFDANLKGGITLANVEEMFNRGFATDYAKKNLWHLSVGNLSQGGAPDVNMFAINVGYSPATLAGEGVRVGSGWFASMQGKERVEMRVTTYDDADGSIKRWFMDLASRAAHIDGTFGLPIDYLVRITVTHAYVVEGVANAYTDSYIMEPGTIEYELDRREDGLQELQLSFRQFDSFSNLV